MSAGIGDGLRRDGRIAGALYLAVVATGMFCLAWVPSRLGTGIADASAYMGLFRAGIAAFLLMQVAFLLLPFALYRVFAGVNRNAATLMVALAAASVPIGASWLFSSTAALSSKRMIDPSGRRTPLRVRTTTAFITWPFLTRPRGIASFTVTLITSPTRA